MTLEAPQNAPDRSRMATDVSVADDGLSSEAERPQPD
jgi:hypothetical protein